MLRRTAKIVMAGALLVPLLATACNTVQGAGQDIRNTGAWIEKKAGEKK